MGNIRVVASELVLGGYHLCKETPAGYLGSSFPRYIRGRCPKADIHWEKELVEQSILWTNTGKPKKLSALPLNPRVLRLGLEFNVKATSLFLQASNS